MAETTKNILEVDVAPSVDKTDYVFINDNNTLKQVSVENLLLSDGTSDLLWRPTVSETGEISWERSWSTELPASENIMGPAGPVGPRGETGPTGPAGDPGPTGATPNIQIGTVQTLEPEQQATASMTGTPENPLLNLGIPKGAKGDPGEGGGGESYTLPIMSDTQLGGGKAVEKTDEDVPVAVDPETGQLYVPTYPESGEITVQQMQNTDTTVTLQPNILYIFPEMATLDVTIPQTEQEIHFFFDSGATATVFSLQAQGGGQIYTDAYSIDTNMRYEVSVLHNVAYIKGVSMSEA